jgi:hypothetical protein
MNQGHSELLPVHAAASKHDNVLVRIARRYGTYLLIIAPLFLLIIPNKGLTARFLFEQDAPALVFSGIALILIPRLAGQLRATPVLAGSRLAFVLAISALAVSFIGWWAVFGGFPLSRDEFLADFDAEILKRGMLIAQVPIEWQGLAPALMPLHMLEISPSLGWVSSYLPVNAAFRAVMDLGIGKTWTGPCLAAVSVLALFDIARRLWPECRPATAVTVVLLALSPQFLVTAMTPLAMTAHLALNLLWLCCYLRGSRAGDLGAILLGFLATGLHQIIFHPLFVVPFICELFIARRWARGAFYALGYIGIALFWTSYWHLALFVTDGGAPALPVGSDTSIFVARMIRIFFANDITAIPLMILNLFRFAAWQHILLLPLAILAWPAIRAAEGIARPLVIGPVLMLVLVTILLPWQGFGWGYRYLHGFLGNACLLAGYGWLRSGGSARGDARRSVFVIASLVTASLLLPFHLVGAYRLVKPYRDASAFIGRSPSALVLVDPAGIEFGHELVRNDPDLQNRPIIVDLANLTQQQIRHLCERGPFPIFDERHGRHFGLPPAPPSLSQRKLLDQLGCGVPLPLPKPSVAAAGVAN